MILQPCTPSDKWAVRVIIPVESSAVILVKHDEKNQQPPFWVFPGGKIEVGETIIEAGIREAKEETGLEVQLGTVVYVRESSRNNVEFYVLASGYSGDLVLGHDPDKTDQVLAAVEAISFVQLADFEQFVMYPRTVQKRLADDLTRGLTSTVYLGDAP